MLWTATLSAPSLHRHSTATIKTIWLLQLLALFEHKAIGMCWHQMWSYRSCLLRHWMPANFSLQLPYCSCAICWWFSAWNITALPNHLLLLLLKLPSNSKIICSFLTFRLPGHFSSMTFRPAHHHLREYPVVKLRLASLTLNTAMVGLNAPAM